MDALNMKNEQEAGSIAYRIKLSAMKLFSLYGYGSTTVRMIAQEAGISPGQITVHFGSKEELFGNIIQDIIEISNAAARPIIEKREQYLQEGHYTKELAWELIHKLVGDLIDYCFVPYNRMCIMMLNIELPNSKIVDNARQTVQKTILAQQEILLAQLLQDYSEKKGSLECRVISRAVNGAIVSFAEHKEFLMTELYAAEDSTTLMKSKEYLENLVLNGLQMIDNMKDYVNEEKR